MNKIRFLFLISIFVFQQGNAQLARLTEEDVQLEKSFIEALSQRLKGNEAEALKQLEELAAIDRRNDAVLYELARTQKVLEDDQKALETINRAIRLDPRNKWYLLFRAGLEEQMGLYNTAADTYSQVIDLDVEQPMHYYRRAENFLRVGKPLEALQTLEDLENKLGSFEEVHQRKYDIYRNIGELNLAIIEIKALLALYPTNTEYLFMLGTHLRQTGFHREADSLFNYILEIEPSDARAGLALANQQQVNQDDASHLRTLFPIFKNPNADLNAKIIELIPYVEQLMGARDEKLINALLESIQLIQGAHPKEPKVHAIMADVYQLNDQYDEAIEEYKKSLQYERGVYTVWEQLQYLLLETGRSGELLKFSEQSLDVFPNQIRFWIFNGIAYRDLGKLKDALSSLEQAYFMGVGNSALLQEVLSLKAAVLFEMGEISQSQKTFDEARALLPDNKVIISRQAFYMARDEKSITNAELLLNEQLINFPDNPLLGGTLAFVLYKKKEKENAIRTLDQFIKRHHDDKKLIQIKQLIQEDNEKELINFWRGLLEGVPT